MGINDGVSWFKKSERSDDRILREMFELADTLERVVGEWELEHTPGTGPYTFDLSKELSKAREFIEVLRNVYQSH
jgi:hypothetical protein